MKISTIYYIGNDGYYAFEYSLSYGRMKHKIWKRWRTHTFLSYKFKAKGGRRRCLGLYCARHSQLPAAKNSRYCSAYRHRGLHPPRVDTIIFITKHTHSFLSCVFISFQFKNRAHLDSFMNLLIQLLPDTYDWVPGPLC